MAIKGGALARAFWAFDRALGGQRPPTRSQMFAARRPLVVWLVAGIFLWGPFILVFEGDVLPALGVGMLLGGWFALFARFERARQRRLVRLGVWDGIHPHSVGETRAMDKQRIYGENLRPLCEVLAHFAEHDFGDSEWEVVEAALSGTDVERDAWYSHRLTGRRTFTVRIAAVPDSIDAFVEIYGVLGGRGKFLMGGVIHVLSKYRVS
ncbi:hypothetical protein ACF1A5_12490 [Streptomyces sp. NPDC014864]|uniref:hypothetical protein n=1 Tax=Streptomyces sp. NPDC014864 TaxID=3364924 RepID=UPI0036FAD99A